MSGTDAGLDMVTRAEVRAALAAGASPAAALIAAADRRREDDGHVLQAVAAELRAGRSLAAAAEGVDTGDPAADLLVRALGVAERSGAGTVTAVDQADAAARDRAELARLLHSRTVQARGTAMVLGSVPVLAWVLLVGLDRAALGFYATALGAATGGMAAALAGAGQWWSRRLVAAAGRAGADADPLTSRAAPQDPARLLAVAVPAFVIVGLGAGPPAGLAAAALALAVGARRGKTKQPTAVRSPSATVGGGAAETIELVAVALEAGLSASAAVTAVASLAPSPARPVLADAAGRLRSGWDSHAAFGGGALAPLGATLAVTERWGAPAAPALRRLADDLRAARRGAIEAAAERTQLTLIFPTTLLMLPAFVLGVVPPLLWTAFAR